LVAIDAKDFVLKFLERKHWDGTENAQRRDLTKEAF
jgi:hypothetical protein